MKYGRILTLALVFNFFTILTLCGESNNNAFLKYLPPKLDTILQVNFESKVYSLIKDNVQALEKKFAVLTNTYGLSLNDCEDVFLGQFDNLSFILLKIDSSVKPKFNEKILTSKKIENKEGYVFEYQEGSKKLEFFSTLLAPNILFFTESKNVDLYFKTLDSKTEDVEALKSNNAEIFFYQNLLKGKLMSQVSGQLASLEKKAKSIEISASYLTDSKEYDISSILVCKDKKEASQLQIGLFFLMNLLVNQSFSNDSELSAEAKDIVKIGGSEERVTVDLLFNDEQLDKFKSFFNKKKSIPKEVAPKQ